MFAGYKKLHHKVPNKVLFVQSTHQGQKILTNPVCRWSLTFVYCYWQHYTILITIDKQDPENNSQRSPRFSFFEYIYGVALGHICRIQIVRGHCHLGFWQKVGGFLNLCTMPQPVILFSKRIFWLNLAWDVWKGWTYCQLEVLVKRFATFSICAPVSNLFHNSCCTAERRFWDYFWASNSLRTYSKMI